MAVNGSGWTWLAVVRVVAGVCLTAWGVFVTLVFGLWSLSEGNGSALAAGVGFMLAGLLTAVPRGHRRGGFVALGALLVGVALIVVGWKVSGIDSYHGAPKDAGWWLHGLGGAALIALGGTSIGRLPSAERRHRM